MKLKLQVAYLQPNGQQVEETIETTIATVAAWERKMRKKITDLQGGIGVDDLMFMAWHRLTALKKENRDYDAWLETVQSYDVPEAEASNPTEAAASAAS
jgi:hypothetical protein